MSSETPAKESTNDFTFKPFTTLSQLAYSSYIKEQGDRIDYANNRFGNCIGKTYLGINDKDLYKNASKGLRSYEMSVLDLEQGEHLINKYYKAKGLELDCGYTITLSDELGEYTILLDNGVKVVLNKQPNELFRYHLTITW